MWVTHSVWDGTNRGGRQSGTAMTSSPVQAKTRRRMQGCTSRIASPCQPAAWTHTPRYSRGRTRACSCVLLYARARGSVSDSHPPREVDVKVNVAYAYMTTQRVHWVVAWLGPKNNSPVCSRPAHTLVACITERTIHTASRPEPATLHVEAAWQASQSRHHGHCLQQGHPT